MEIGLRKSVRGIRFAFLVILFAWLGQSGWLLRAELYSIHLYQQVGSPVASLVVTCRFEPTCSHYAVNALEHDGFLVGNLKTAARLAHCSPFGALADWLRGTSPRLKASSGGD